MKHFGAIIQSCRESTFQETNLASDISPVPPYGDSQPIPSGLATDVLQLIETGSPYLTTTLGGLSWMGQEALTG